MRWFQMGHLSSKGTDVAIEKPEDTLQHITGETVAVFPAFFEKTYRYTETPGTGYSDGVPIQ